MFLLLRLVLACAPDTSDVETTEPEPCGEGFARADDGNCYAFEVGAEWEVARVECVQPDTYDRPNTYYTAVDIGADAGSGPVDVEVWSHVADGVQAYCAEGFDDCPVVPPDAEWEVDEDVGLDADGAVLVACERFVSAYQSESWSDGYAHDYVEVWFR